MHRTLKYGQCVSHVAIGNKLQSLVIKFDRVVGICG